MISDASGNIDSLSIYKTQYNEKINQMEYQKAYDVSTKLYNNYWKHPDSMLLWANHRYDLALKIKDPYLEAKSLYEISFSTFQLGQFEASVTLAAKADTLLQSYPADELRCKILYRLAESYEYTGRHELGMQKYSECYTLAEELDLKKTLVTLDLKFGDIHKYNKYIPKALKYYSGASNRLSKQENPLLYFEAIGNVFNLKILNPDLFSKNELVQACDSVIIFYNIIKTDEELKKMEPYYFKLFISCISTNNNLKEVNKITLPTIDQIQKKYSNRNHMILFLSGYFDLAILRQDFTQAEKYVNELYGFYKDDVGEQNLGYKQLALNKDRILKTTQKNYKALIPILDEIHEIELKLKAEDRMVSIIDYEGLLEKKEKEYEINILNKEKEVLFAQSQQRLLLTIGFALISLLGFGFFWNARQKNKIIQLQNKQLELVNNIKDQLFAIIGHDLRKPAISFRGISKKIGFLIQKKDFSRLEQFGIQIEQNALALNKLTDNLLNWALVQRDVMPYNPAEVNIGEIAADLETIFKTPASEKNIAVNIDMPSSMVVFADPNALMTILTNLVDNAIKYTKAGGTIRIDAFEENDQVKIRVSDTGIGMEKDKINDLFLLKKDKSLKGTTGEKGTGLGLHLVKELVELNKGIINIASEIGKGTSCELSLPSIKV